MILTAAQIGFLIANKKKLISHLSDGDLRLFRREVSGSYELIGEATDENPTLIEYISFGSWHNNLVQFYFNCSFSSDTPSVSVATGNLLLRDKIPPRLTLTNCK